MKKKSYTVLCSTAGSSVTFDFLFPFTQIRTIYLLSMKSSVLSAVNAELDHVTYFSIAPGFGPQLPGASILNPVFSVGAMVINGAVVTSTKFTPFSGVVELLTSVRYVVDVDMAVVAGNKIVSVCLTVGFP